MADVVTPEMRQAVRKEECLTRGHSFDVVAMFGTLAPQYITCSNCGSHWRIHPEDREKNF